jgi:glycerophosphoryl diester phosphodiesterase
MKLQTSPLIIYHRGRHGVTGSKGAFLNENTLEAFEEAIAENAEMIEFDVWGELAVTHDPGTSLVTLTDVLDLVRGRCRVNVEIKSPLAVDAAAEEIRRQLVRPCWEPSDFVVSAFHHLSAVRFKQLVPELIVGIVNDGILLPEYVRLLSSLGINNLHMQWCSLYMDQEAGGTFRQVALDNGMHIWTWTVNSLEVYQSIAGYGVTGVFTDFPELFREV